MENKTVICLEFVIEGDDFDLCAIEDALQMKSTQSWKKGDFIRDGLYRAQTSWSYGTCLQNELFVSDALEKFILIFEDKIDKILSIEKKYNVDIFFLILIKIYDDKPDISISKKVIKFAAQCNMDIIYDWYIFTDREDN